MNLEQISCDVLMQSCWCIVWFLYRSRSVEKWVPVPLSGLEAGAQFRLGFRQQCEEKSNHELMQQLHTLISAQFFHHLMPRKLSV
jgi:hypothetical protein